MDGMKFYTVLYRNSHMNGLDVPLGFQCWADNTEHAEEQCEDAEKDDPGMRIAWVHETESEHTMDDALNNWYDW